MTLGIHGIGNHTKISVINTSKCQLYYTTFCAVLKNQLCHMYDIATMENCFKKWVMSDTCFHMQCTNEHTTKNIHSHCY